MAVLEGRRFQEYAASYCRLGTHEACDAGDLPGRLSAVVGLACGELPSHIGFSSGLQITCPCWRQVGLPTWIAEDSEEAHEKSEAQEWCRRFARRSGLPVRLPTFAERALSGMPTSGCPPPRGRDSGEFYVSEWCLDREPWSYFYGTKPLVVDLMGSGEYRPAFSLAPDQEHLIEAYLVEGR